MSQVNFENISKEELFSHAEEMREALQRAINLAEYGVHMDMRFPGGSGKQAIEVLQKFEELRSKAKAKQ